MNLSEEIIAGLPEVVQPYYRAPELHLPVRHSQHSLEISDLQVTCKSCGKEAAELRGEVREYPQCLDVQAGGACAPCRRITYFSIRYYHDGRWLHRRDEGWVEIVSHTPWWKKLGLRVRGWFWR